MAKVKDELGNIYGVRTVVGGPDLRLMTTGMQRAYWRCRCSCGREDWVDGTSLRRGIADTCPSCRANAMWDKRGRSGAYVDGQPTRERVSYNAMLSRCYNKNNSRYASHGGRGIRVCERWQGSFTDFLADMGLRPENTSLDRIDNDGDYEPGNCRWATPTQQAANTKQAKLHTLNGETLTQAEWARKYLMKPQTLSKRLQQGMTLSEALRIAFA